MATMAILWDVENVAVPSFLRPDEFSRAFMRHAGRVTGTSPRMIVGLCSESFKVAHLPPRIREWLAEAGFTHVQVPNPKGKTERVDMKIMSRMMSLVTAGKVDVLYIISEDRDFDEVAASIPATTRVFSVGKYARKASSEVCRVTMPSFFEDRPDVLRRIVRRTVDRKQWHSAEAAYILRRMGLSSAASRDVVEDVLAQCVQTSPDCVKDRGSPSPPPFMALDIPRCIEGAVEEVLRERKGGSVVVTALPGLVARRLGVAREEMSAHRLQETIGCNWKALLTAMPGVDLRVEEGGHLTVALR